MGCNINPLFLTFIIFMTLSCSKDQKPNSIFYENHAQYKQEGLDNRRFNHSKIKPLILSLESQPGFSVKEAGKSVQGKEIYLVSIGKGKNTVLLWSQMHGDESTATMALMDIFNFFKSSDELDSLRQIIFDNLTIHFLPMLNPDGADVFKRRNALDIDLNRDALRLQSPEAKILKAVRDSIDADFGFNLHDQNTRYTAGKSNKPATISFLAPAFDEEKSIDPGREKAMKLVVEMNSALQKHIPGQVGKYSDEFEPRAFGDNIQKWGTNTVLIESGGYLDDPQKQYIRKLNFAAIMEGLLSIATASYSKNTVEEYFAIPNNELYLYNLMIREVLVEENGKEYTVDLGINREEVNTKDNRNFYYKSVIEDMGDLSVFYGYEEIDTKGMKAEPGKVYPDVFQNMKEIKELNFHELLAEGYTTVRVKKLPKKSFVSFPLNVVGQGLNISNEIALNAAPNFVLRKGGNVKYAVVNGFIYDIDAKKSMVKNALVSE